MPEAAEGVGGGHILIAGTGRAGTSFLVRYLTGLGLDTHLSRWGDQGWDDEANAGLEDMPLLNPELMPTVIKAPWSFEFISDLLASDAIRISTAIVPVRDLRDAAASRAVLERRAIHAQTDWLAAKESVWERWGYTPGGNVFSLSAVDQARLLAVGFHHTVQQLVAAGVPLLLLAFPRLIEDADYLFHALRPVLPAGATVEEARAVHGRIADPGKVRVRTRAAESTVLRGPAEEEIDWQALKRELVRMRALLTKKDEAIGTAATELGALQQEVGALQHEVAALRAAVPAAVPKSREAAEVAARPASGALAQLVQRLKGAAWKR